MRIAPYVNLHGNAAIAMVLCVYLALPVPQMAMAQEAAGETGVGAPAIQRLLRRHVIDRAHDHPGTGHGRVRGGVGIVAEKGIETGKKASKGPTIAQRLVILVAPKNN